ncbi:MAG: hypothetical protein WC045_01730 [Patescibacteria group bacterium]
MNTVELLRQYRIGSFAIFDFAISFVAVALLAPLLSWAFRKLKVNVPFTSWMFFTIPTSILVHIIVGRYTPLTRAVVDPHGHILEKIIILILIVAGLKGISRIKK